MAASAGSLVLSLYIFFIGMTSTQMFMRARARGPFLLHRRGHGVCFYCTGEVNSADSPPPPPIWSPRFRSRGRCGRVIRKDERPGQSESWARKWERARTACTTDFVQKIGTTRPICAKTADTVAVVSPVRG
jgi:hypothetical protein